MPFLIFAKQLENLEYQVVLLFNYKKYAVLSQKSKQRIPETTLNRWKCWVFCKGTPLLALNGSLMIHPRINIKRLGLLIPQRMFPKLKLIQRKPKEISTEIKRSWEQGKGEWKLSQLALKIYREGEDLYMKTCVHSSLMTFFFHENSTVKESNKKV